jgi:hypothetical protein
VRSVDGVGRCRSRHAGSQRRRLAWVTPAMKSAGLEGSTGVR